MSWVLESWLIDQPHHKLFSLVQTFIFIRMFLVLRPFEYFCNDHDFCYWLPLTTFRLYFSNSAWNFQQIQYHWSSQIWNKRLNIKSSTNKLNWNTHDHHHLFYSLDLRIFILRQVRCLLLCFIQRILFCLCEWVLHIEWVVYTFYLFNNQIETFIQEYMH